MKKTRWTIAGILILCQTAIAADSWLHITHEETPELPGNEIQFIKPTDDGQGYWVGTLTGAARLENGSFEPIARTRNMQVWDILEQRDGGGLWVGFESGLLELRGNAASRSLAGHTVAAIRRVGDETWIIAKNLKTERNCLMRLKNGEWTSAEEMEGRYVEDIKRDAEGRYWLMLDGDGVLEVDPDTGLDEAHHHLQGVNVTSVMTDSRGRVWCGLWGGGVMMRDEGGWTRHLARERAAILSLLEDDERNIWAATSGNGIWVYDGERWQGMLQDEGSISLMTRTDDGRIWISTQTQGGLRFWNGQQWIVSLDTFLPIRTLVDTADGELIAGGVLDGIYILKR